MNTKSLKLLQGSDAVPVLKAIGYIDGTMSCMSCQNYSGMDYSGKPQALPEHCKLNPAFLLKIEPNGWCEHWTKKVIPSPKHI